MSDGKGFENPKCPSYGVHYKCTCPPNTKYIEGIRRKKDKNLALEDFNTGDAGLYIGERAQKPALPLGLGYLLFCPLTSYIKALYEEFQGEFIRFLPHF